MNYFEEDEYHIWRIKLELAKEGSFQAIQDIKNHISPNMDPKHPFIQANYTKVTPTLRSFSLIPPFTQ